ncbi:MAG: HD-GYP domain-containing protein [Phycisphaerales bacterium]
MDTAVLQSLVKSIELKDRCTAAHTWRVVLYSRAVAEDAGLDSAFIERLTLAAALHDLGKIEVPDAILQKPGRLTEDEYEAMKSHAAIGHRLLLDMGVEDPVMLALVRHHHERWDGGGYPDGLSGEAIPLAARYFAVIDSFDAMTGVRPYRPSLDDTQLERALEQLHAGRGTQFAPEGVDRFLKLFSAGDLEWILHYFNDEVPVPMFDPGAARRLGTGGGGGDVGRVRSRGMSVGGTPTDGAGVEGGAR